jgi:hypothetical protein
MGAYINYAYYTDEYIGETIAESDFTRYLNRAEEAVDILTAFTIRQNGIDAYDAFTQTQIKKAVAAQVEYYVLEGIDIATGGKTATGFTVGKVSVQGGGSVGNSNGATTIACPKAIAMLEPTGLLYRGVNVC